MRSITVLLLLTLIPLKGSAQDELPKSRPELTRYEETSRYDDVMRFFAELQKRSPLLRVETFGNTQEGRALPLVILANPPISQPRDTRASGKPVVFIMANIHGGEVEGKEAAQHLSRRILSGDLRALLDRLIILIAPIYNADGNERISPQNRTDQNGPLAGVGTRENANGLDLNRDYMKLEAAETQALVLLFNRWDPHITVDLHTTNGSYHGYHLTYSIPLNPAVDPRIIAFHREQMMPAITQAMLAQHKFRTYYYGNFSGPAPKTGEPETRTWRAFDHRPRIGQNYVGFRNRLTILSEAYSYLDFRRRVEVTEAFVEEICKFVAKNGDEISQLARRVDADAMQRATGTTTPLLGVEYEMKPLPTPAAILLGQVTKLMNPRSGREMTVMTEDKTTSATMLDYGLFAATRRVPTAHAYLFRLDAGLRETMAKLLGHGIAVEELTEALTTEVERFAIENVKRTERAFQGHHEVRLTGEYKKESITFPAGTILVRGAQPLGVLASYLLEPESDDGLVAWNFLDPYLAPGKIFPISKLMQAPKTASRLLQ